MEANGPLKEYLNRVSEHLRAIYTEAPTVEESTVEGFDYEGDHPDEEGDPVCFPAISIEGLWYAHPTNVEDIENSSWRLEKIDPGEHLLLEVGEWETFDAILFQIIVSVAAQMAYEMIEGGPDPDAVITIHRDNEDITVASSNGNLEALGEDGRSIELTPKEVKVALELINDGVNEMGIG
jgi:hypothetical protein